MHRVGGIEKEDGTGNISYDPENHDKMTRCAPRRSTGIANDIPTVEVDDPDGAELVVRVVGRHVGRGDRGGAARARPRPRRSRTCTCGT